MGREGHGSQPTSMHESPGAAVVISEVQADGSTEQVIIANRGQIDQPLTGWALASLHGLEVFQFPDGVVLPWGKQVRVLSGENPQKTAQQDLLWTRQDIWNNRSDTVLLFDNEGHEVSRFMYPRPTVRENRTPKLKVLVHDIDGYHLQDWNESTAPGRDRH